MSSTYDFGGFMTSVMIVFVIFIIVFGIAIPYTMYRGIEDMNTATENVVLKITNDTSNEEIINIIDVECSKISWFGG